ncbi:MAG: ABC transporter ATP-binding protein [Actinobacteria bacterium]|nr:ABC transporter ATP-binding protein [Actinomycetota bacterium]
MKTAIKNKLGRTTVMRSLKVLPKSDRPRIIFVILLQAGLGFIDLIGVAAIGVLGALSVTGVQSQQPGNRVSSILQMLGISKMSFQAQVAILGLGAAFIFVFRTILSILITRKILFFLSRRGAALSSKLVGQLLSQSLIKVQSRSTQESVYALTAGVSAITLSILGVMVTIIADSSLLILMLLALLIVDPIIALTSVLFFSSLGLALYRSMHVKAHRLGFENSKLAIQGNTKIIEVLESYRELVVRNRRDYYAREIGSIQRKLADVLAEVQFMPNVSKYVIESGMVVGAVVIAGVQFALQDASRATAALSVFLAAGTRIAPAILRLQQSFIQMRGGFGAAIPTLELIESLKDVPEVEHVEDTLDHSHLGFEPSINLNSIYFTYPEKDSPTLSDLSVNLIKGSATAIVGPSGAGKTTLVDILLGVLQPDKGDVTISGLKPLEAISKWPGAIAYVPQDVALSNGTFRENLTMGYPINLAPDELCWDALRIAQLDNFVRDLPLGLDQPIGERGTNLSGGQRQRLGIARAMLTKPKLLVLDEATSALDGQTELDISTAINELKGIVTVVMIAHRLSTVRNSDQVIYLDNGKIITKGKFEEVRQTVPDFDRQAQLMGL